MGCVDPNACNYEAEATIPGYCHYGYWCWNGEMVCYLQQCPDEPPHVYCNNPEACNYHYHESCILPVQCLDGGEECDPPYGPGCDCLHCNPAHGCPPGYQCITLFPGQGSCCVRDDQDTLGDGDIIGIDDSGQDALGIDDSVGGS